MPETPRAPEKSWKPRWRRIPVRARRRWILWLGRIWKRALLPARALEACELGANSSAELSAYAGLCVARSLNALGRPREALLRLDGLSVPEAALAERELLIARSAALAGDTERAIQTYRGIVAAGGEAPAADSALALAELLSNRAAGVGDAEEALGLSRRVRVAQSPNRELSRRAEQLEGRALAGLPAARQSLLSRLSSDERLSLSSALLRARDNEAAEREATELLRSLPASERFERVGCEAELVLAKARAALRRNQEATDGLAEARARCLGDDDRGARIWFLSGRYAASAGQPAAAVAFYAGVEARFPAHSLADDARYYAAQSYLELGAEDRFTELSSSLPERYPKGDMVAEGLFRLALRRMDRGAWSEAALLLEQGVSWVGDSDATRGFDLVGRERYFRARALHALGKSAQARAELAELIRAFPLSYYMLQAYSRLHSLDPEAARIALATAKSAAHNEPFRVVRRPQIDQPGIFPHARAFTDRRARFGLEGARSARPVTRRNGLGHPLGCGLRLWPRRLRPAVGGARQAAAVGARSALAGGGLGASLASCFPSSLLGHRSGRGPRQRHRPGPGLRGDARRVGLRPRRRQSGRRLWLDAADLAHGTLARTPRQPDCHAHRRCGDRRSTLPWAAAR